MFKRVLVIFVLGYFATAAAAEEKSSLLETDTNDSVPARQLDFNPSDFLRFLSEVEQAELIKELVKEEIAKGNVLEGDWDESSSKLEFTIPIVHKETGRTWRYHLQ